MAVVIRMKKMGRAHRAFFRICATDKRAPRDGRVLEELGTYDPSVPETDARAVFNQERVAHWLSSGANSPSAASSWRARTAIDGPSMWKKRRAAGRVSENPKPSAPSDA